MKRQRRHPRQRRRGAVLILVAIAMIPLLGMVALAVDYGYLLKEKTDLQGAADATALAAVLSLAPDPDGYQDLAAVRAAVREYAAANAGDNFTVLDGDIVIGRFVPSTIYTSLQIDSSGVLDTVRVTLRRDDRANGGATLYFAKVLGFRSTPIAATATAALQKASGLKEGSDILPCAVPLVEWNGQEIGDAWNIYGDGRILAHPADAYVDLKKCGHVGPIWSCTNDFRQENPASPRVCCTTDLGYVTTVMCLRSTNEGV